MKSNKLIISILSVICVLSLSLMIYALCRTAPKNTEFVPPEFDANAVEGIPYVPEEYEWSEIYKEGMSFRVGISKKIVSINNYADVYLYNNEDNNVWLKLRILDEEGNILGESGLIKAGEYIKSVTLTESIYDGQKVKLKIMTYQPHTYYSEGSIMLNTNIEKRLIKN